MRQSHEVFNAAVSDFEKLLVDAFWRPLSVLLSYPSLMGTQYVYGPNKVMVPLTSELFLGHDDYNAVLMDFFTNDPPSLSVDECPLTPKHALQCLFGIRGQSAGPSPYDVLSNIILDIEKRVIIARQVAWQTGDAALIYANNQFEVEYFPYFEQLLRKYQSAEQYAKNTIFSQLIARFQVGFW